MGTESPDRFEHVSGFRTRLESQGWWHSFELPDGTIIEGANSLEGLRHRIDRFPIPGDLRGKRALDIGTWDGWFAFEMERRGANVVAIDNIDNPRFREMHAIYGSKVDYRQIDVYDLTPARVGQFDVVLFMGVLYHLKHPLLGLERVCALSRDLVAVDSFVLQEKYAEGALLDRPLLEFFENDQFGGQTDNWVAPNLPCLLAMCRTAGFAQVQLEGVGDFGAAVTCRRKWESADGRAEPSSTELLAATHHMNFGLNFDSTKDDYVTCRFRHPGIDLQIADVQPSVGPYGVIPIHLHACGDGCWECSMKLPPGLTAGWHDVAVRVLDEAPATGKRIAVDMPVRGGWLRLKGVFDGTSWCQHELDRSRGDTISVWLAGLAPNADRSNIKAWMEDEPLAVDWVEDLASKKHTRQVNLLVPDAVRAGEHRLRIRAGGSEVKSRRIKVFRHAIS